MPWWYNLAQFFAAAIHCFAGWVIDAEDDDEREPVLRVAS